MSFQDTCRHEAGHAVASVLCGRPAWAVTVKPSEGYDGKAVFNDIAEARKTLDSEDHEAASELATTVAVVALAGHVAESGSLAGWRIPASTSGDEQIVDVMARELAERGLGPPALHVERFTARAQALASRPRFQEAVRRVADELERARILAGGTVERIVREVEEDPTSLPAFRLQRLKKASSSLLEELERLQELLPPPPRPQLHIVERS